MPEQFLNRTDVIAVFQQMRDDRVPQRIAAGWLGQPYVSRDLFNSSVL
jgi:hypothetical protein